MAEFIYVVRTLGSFNEVSSIERPFDSLVKIGSTTFDEPLQRFKHANQESTFLFANVDVCKIYECINCKAITIEKQIHRFLDYWRWEITLTSPTGKNYRPREWFTISPQVAMEVVERALNKELHKYEMNKVSPELRLKAKYS